VPGVTFTEGVENVQVVLVGRFDGHTRVTVPLNTLSGTTWRSMVMAAPPCTETDMSWPVANCNS
jgi:hypothetical protein